VEIVSVDGENWTVWIEPTVDGDPAYVLPKQVIVADTGDRLRNLWVAQKAIRIALRERPELAFDTEMY
jgi:hypothetical protein